MCCRGVAPLRFRDAKLGKWCARGKRVFPHWYVACAVTVLAADAKSLCFTWFTSAGESRKLFSTTYEQLFGRAGEPSRGRQAVSLRLLGGLGVPMWLCVRCLRMLVSQNGRWPEMRWGGGLPTYRQKGESLSVTARVAALGGVGNRLLAAVYCHVLMSS